MSKKKSTNKAKSPSVDEVKVDEVKDDDVKDEANVSVNENETTGTDTSTVETGVIDNSATETPASQASAQPDSDSQTATSNEKSVTPAKSDDPVSSTKVKKPTEETDASEPNDTKQTDKPLVRRGFAFLAILNLLLIIGLMATAFYYWQIQQESDAEKQSLLLELQTRVDKKADLAQVQADFSPLKSDIGSSESRIDTLQQKQQTLQDSTKKLFDLYARSDSDWRLAEVAYLLRIAQHKLALENDFEGAALTLQAASDKIATTADPGFLPVRVLISEEIADLKTRTRPDLVGMTLLLSQLSQQIQTLKPGYQPAITDTSTTPTESSPIDALKGDATIEEKVTSFFNSLVTFKRNTAKPTTTEARIVNIEEIMTGNLKLTRWTVLERDDFQYRQLMKENIRLFKQYYDLENAANNDFYSQLLQLQKSVIKPTKPSIDGSLQLLNKIISQRQNAPDPGKISPEAAAPESVNEAADNV